MHRAGVFPLSRAYGALLLNFAPDWIPAFAGMTEKKWPVL